MLFALYPKRGQKCQLVLCHWKWKYQQLLSAASLNIYTIRALSHPFLCAELPPIPVEVRLWICAAAHRSGLPRNTGKSGAHCYWVRKCKQAVFKKSNYVDKPVSTITEYSCTCLTSASLTRSRHMPEILERMQCCWSHSLQSSTIPPQTGTSADWCFSQALRVEGKGENSLGDILRAWACFLLWFVRQHKSRHSRVERTFFSLAKHAFFCLLGLQTHLSLYMCNCDGENI